MNTQKKFRFVKLLIVPILPALVVGLFLFFFGIFQDNYRRSFTGAVILVAASVYYFPLCLLYHRYKPKKRVKDDRSAEELQRVADFLDSSSVYRDCSVDDISLMVDERLRPNAKIDTPEPWASSFGKAVTLADKLRVEYNLFLSLNWTYAGYHAMFRDKRGDICGEVIGKSMPRSICIAAIVALNKWQAQEERRRERIRGLGYGDDNG